MERTHCYLLWRLKHSPLHHAGLRITFIPTSFLSNSASSTGDLWSGVLQISQHNCGINSFIVTTMRSWSFLTYRDDVSPERVVELARKYKEVFEKKPSEIEHFLTNCNSRIGSAAMMVAIKALYDTSIGRSNEQGADRAVEFLKHFIEDGSMVAEHLKLIPDIG
uniref:Uncharacterized protein n=1 Tax=Angiostrongylus cantonensis TaxID=6313 RepID=A0A0K0CZU5_ANGCA